MEFFFKHTKKLIIASITLFILLAIIGYFVINGDDTNLTYKDHHIAYNDGWDLTIHGSTEENVTLPVYVKTSKHESAVLSRELPDVIPDDSAITTRNYHQILEVRVDGELIFSLPNENWNHASNIISDEWCLIEIKPEYAGKTLEMSYTNTTVFPFTAYIGDYYFGDDNSIVHHIRDKGFPGTIIGIIMISIGLLLFMISIFYRKHTNQSTNTAMGLAFMCFGFWMANRSKMGLFSAYSFYVYQLALMALLLVAPLVFLYSFFRNHAFKRTAFGGFIICALCDIFLVSSSFFINYDIEIICMFSYGLTALALTLNAYSLFQGGFGKPIPGQRPIDRLLDQTEFISNLIFPVFGTVELLTYNRMLWTESSEMFMTAILVYAFIYWFFIFWRTFLVVQDRTNVTKQLHDSRMELMMGQIQPHFIFNTLSSIRTLVMVDPKLSYDMLYDFSNYLRANIDNVTNLEGIKFSAEVEHIKSYVNIEKVRFGDRLEVEYDIQSDDFTVPPLSIQPLVENAIKHGVCKKMEGGTVYLRSYETDDFYVVEVDDNGIGFNAESASKVFGAFLTGNASNHKNGPISPSDLGTVIESLNLLDKEGEKIQIIESAIVSEPSLTGNGSEKHHSAGMMNIMLRLKEMSTAKVEIESKENEGTTIKVLFPKKVADAGSDDTNEE